jgi:hypothetical protein
MLQRSKMTLIKAAYNLTNRLRNKLLIGLGIFPEVLCRVTYPAYLKSDGEYLYPHGFNEDSPNGLSVPLVHPNEWQTIAKFFNWNRDNSPARGMRLVRIKAEQIEGLVCRSHDRLGHGEYFGRVPKKAILEVIEYNS